MRFVSETSRLEEILENIGMEYLLERFSGFDEPVDGDW